MSAVAYAAVLTVLAGAAVVYGQTVAAWLGISGAAVLFREAVVACRLSHEEES